MKEQSTKTAAKRKFFKVVFSRAGIFVILILLQLLVSTVVTYYLREYATFVYSLLTVLEVVVLIYIINTEGNPAFKMNVDFVRAGISCDWNRCSMSMYICSWRRAFYRIDWRLCVWRQKPIWTRTRRS